MPFLSDIKKQTPIEIVQFVTGALKPRAPIVASVESLIAHRGLDVSETWIRGEWINETLNKLGSTPLDMSIERDVTSPDIAYFEFAVAQMDRIYMPSKRIVANLHRDINIPTWLLLMLERTIWSIEIEWCRRYLNHEDDVLVIMADQFLTALQPEQLDLPDDKRNHSRKGASYYFEKLAKYIAERNFTILALDNCQEYQLAPSEIWGANFTPDWKPFALRMMDSAMGEKLRGIQQKSPKAIFSEAERIRAKHMIERNEQSKRAILQLARLNPPLAFYSTLDAGLRLKLNSNQLYQAQERFMKEMEANLIPVTVYYNGSFVDFIKAHKFSRDHKGTSLDEMMTKLARLGSGFTRTIPQFALDAGGNDRSYFVKWRAQIESGLREVPIDLSLDYTMFVLSER